MGFVGYQNLFKYSNDCHSGRDMSVKHLGGNVPIFGALLFRSGEWYLLNRGFRKILARSQNLGGFCVISRSLVYQVSWSLGFFSTRSRSLGYFVEHLEISGILSDQTHIYLKDIVFGHQNI